MSRYLTTVLAGLLMAITASATANTHDSQFVMSSNGRQLTVDGKPYLVLGIQLHNSSGFPAILHRLAPAIARSGANTVMVPIGWESIEPREGHFDFSVLDGLVKEARAQHVRLALLWFGTWKNATMSYVPAWVKRDTRRFPRVIDADGHPIDVLTPIAGASRDADAHAFAALMGHLKQIDGRQRTVIMVQVENEAGTLGADRDHSARANALFDGQVPADMPDAKPGTWTQDYGVRAPEAFMAYYTARYIGAVAAAGKKVYDLPLYVNVWPRQQPGLLRPGQSSPSGGAVSWLLPQWKALAPAIDVVGVDNYDTNVAPYTAIADAYRIKGNPLFVPETGHSMAHARHAIWTVMRPDAVGISMFGITDDFASGKSDWKSSPMAVNYHLLRRAASFLIPLRNAGKVRTAIEERGLANIPMHFDDVDLVARFGEVRDGYGGPRGQGNADVSGRVIAAQVAPHRFLLLGTSANVKFAPKLGTMGHVELLTVEQGHVEHGRWITDRLLNGDETAFGLIFPHDGTQLMVTEQVIQ
ncbi:DUF5597 domain-containing protein [Dyella sp. A6]|uniref:DUF5597 domain-containing protein n=1 Tax=Dyella aluminiiresistens TaxID=3069105 RepID=UPI002E77CE1D|nr:DUF5597 domain-containing protein [Dyella sp. A6]